MGKTELEFDQRVTAEKSAALLEQIAGGLRSGTLNLAAGDESIHLSPAKIVKLELEASSSDDKQKLVVELKWHVNDVRALANDVLATADEARASGEEAQFPVATAPGA